MVTGALVGIALVLIGAAYASSRGWVTLPSLSVRPRPVTIMLLAGLILVLWIGRYDVVAGSGAGESNWAVVFRLDRWTGEVAFCSPTVCDSIGWR